MTTAKDRLRSSPGTAFSINDIETEYAMQASASAIGALQPAITAAGPTNVPGELDLTQAENGPLEDASYLTRGYTPAPVQQPRVGSTPMVAIGAENPAAASAAAAATG